MARTDAQTDQRLANEIAALEERIELAQINQVMSGVQMDATTDPDRKVQFALQIEAHQQDIDVLRSLVTELQKVAGKPESGKKLKNNAKTYRDNAAAIIAAAPPEDKLLDGAP